MIRVAGALCAVLVIFGVVCSWADSFTVDGKTLGEIAFEAPSSKTDRQYLGISDRLSMKLSEIRADALIIEIFNMYCHYCQAEAPNVNKLYQIIQRDPKLHGKVKLIGIGAGNTPYEVRLFKKKFRVPFPMLADPLAEIRKTSKSEFRTPTFITAGRNTGRGFKIIDVHVGRLGDPKRYLDSLMIR